MITSLGTASTITMGAFGFIEIDALIRKGVVLYKP